MPRRKPTETAIQPKEFASVEEIEAAIGKLRRRISDVQALDPQRVRWDSQEVKNVEDGIQRRQLSSSA
jgi:hypothetical protein